MKKKLLYPLLFILTVITTTMSGAEWIYGTPILTGALGFEKVKEGFWFSIPFLAFLTSHEFGHYFMAKIRKVRVSLPYYIPGWLGIALSIGTFGAFIRIKDLITSKKDYFDIGIAGPLAGFVVTVAVLIYGFVNLPGDEYIYKIHPEYKTLDFNYRQAPTTATEESEAMIIGKPLLYQWLENTFADPNKIPHPVEQSHYPILLAGFLGLLFTAINLLPIGQLDGGHILYALIGRKAFNIVSPTILVLLVTYSGLELFTLDEFALAEKSEQTGLIFQFIFYIYFVYLCFSKIFSIRSYNWILTLSIILFQLLLPKIIPGVTGYSGLILFGFLLGRILGVYHPPTLDKEPLGKTRIILGWLAMAIFVISISLNPIS